MRVSVLGDEGAGKTELVTTLTDPEGEKVRDLRPPPEHGTSEWYKQRTPGIKITPFIAFCSALLIFMDYAGQAQFLASHSPLLATHFGMFVLVLNLFTGSEMMLKSARYWLRFVTATRDPKLYPESAPSRLFLAFSHADEIPSSKTEGMVKYVHRIIQKEFSEFFTFIEARPFILNCREESDEMKRLRNGLVAEHKLVTKVSYRNSVIFQELSA